MNPIIQLISVVWQNLLFDHIGYDRQVRCQLPNRGKPESLYGRYNSLYPFSQAKVVANDLPLQASVPAMPRRK